VISWPRTATWYAAIHFKTAFQDSVSRAAFQEQRFKRNRRPSGAVFVFAIERTNGDAVRLAAPPSSS
jgi:hypothetical protein